MNIRTNTLIAVSMVAIVSASTLTTKALAAGATPPVITFAGAGRQSAEHADAQKKLAAGIKKALKKQAELSKADKAKADCPRVVIAVNPGVISKALFSVAVRDVRPGVYTKFTTFSTTKMNGRWFYRGELERVCVIANGNGHAFNEFQPITLANIGFPVSFAPKQTTALYVK